MPTSFYIKKNNAKGILFKIFILLFSIILIGEIINLVFYPQKDKYFLPNENKSTISFNRKLLQFLSNNLSSLPYNYCEDFKLYKAPGVFRVFLIGEVPLSGWPYSKEQSIGKKIENNLNTFAPGKKFEINTISFAGFNSFNAVEIISQVLQFSPDLIIVYNGHNEFYGYKGNVSEFNISKLFTVSIIEQLFDKIGTEKVDDYNNKLDDLELIIPLNSANKYIFTENAEYKNTLSSFNNNFTYIAELCSQNKARLILSELADNNLLPPIGISNTSNQLSADLVFNNARMALLRDGNESIAEKLFNESIELDAFRLRIPPDLNLALKRIANENDLELADLKGNFCRFSQNHIPGNDLFVDYIHPNLAGINIIAAEYTTLILKQIKTPGIPPIEEILKKQSEVPIPSMNMDISLEKQRMEKASEYLRNANLKQKIAPAAINN